MVQIEIEDPAEALKILERLNVDGPPLRSWPSNSTCSNWKHNLKNKIEAAMLKEAENTWKHLSSFDVEGFYAEINEFGDVRINDVIYKPTWDVDYNRYVVEFAILDHAILTKIDAAYFVKNYFNKDLEL